MALTDEVTGRYSSQYIKNLTNPDTPAATSNDTTRLSNASTDAQEWFKRVVGVAYDNTKSAHIAVAVKIVVFILKEYAGQYGPAMEAEKTALLAQMKELADVTGRDRVQPKSKSVLSPSSEDVAGEVDRPSFDSERFKDIIPNKPPAP